MKDYIKAAVEQADGFQLTSDGRYFSLPDGGYVPPIDECPQQYIDALAAQLARQVDDTEYRLIVSGRFTEIMQDNFEDVKRMTSKCIASSKGPNRSMNTIKVVVDSKVLK